MPASTTHRPVRHAADAPGAASEPPASPAPAASSPSPRPAAALVATLGAEPQVVTLALQALNRSGEAIAELVVVHTSASEERLDAAARALDRLARDKNAGGPLCTDRDGPVFRDRDDAAETQLALSYAIACPYFA